MTRNVEGVVAKCPLTAETLRIPSLRGTAEARFWAKVTPGLGDECWIWRGKISSRGYGTFSTAYSSSTMAHRASYVIHNGAIPDGLVVDHICRNRLCVNPAHLRAVTPKVNTLENSLGPTAINAAKTHCSNGHEFDAKNTAIWRGTRRCRKCQYKFMLNNQRRHRREAKLLAQDKSQ